MTAVWVRCPPGTPWLEARITLARAGFHIPDAAYADRTPIAPNTAVGAPPLLHGAVITADPAPPTATRLLELVVTEGPDTGLRCIIDRGEAIIGREPGCALRLTDPEVSRRHCVVVQDQGTTSITDCGSTNGTRAAGQPISAQHATTLRVGTRIRVGRSTLMLTRVTPATAPPEYDGHGHILVRRSPRRTYPLPPRTIDAPRRPQEPTTRPVPWAMILLPLVLALAMVLVFRNTMFLMFALLSPAMVLGQHLTERRSGTPGGRSQDREFARNQAAFVTQKAAMLKAELGSRRAGAPTLTELAQAVRDRSELLWHREPAHPDYLTWRIGTGVVESACTIRSDGVDEHPRLEGCPVTVSLRDHRVTGVCGSPEVADALLASLIMQLGALHTPLATRLLILCDDRQRAHRWAWSHGLPHLSAGNAAQILVAEPDSPELQRLRTRLHSRSGHHGPGADIAPHTVVILDTADCCTASGAVTDLVQHAADHGITVVAIAEHRAELPTTCTAVIEAEDRHRVMVTTDDRYATTPDLPSVPLLTGTMHQLMRLRDALPPPGQAALPDTLDLVSWRKATDDVDLCNPEAIARSWRAGSADMRVDLGVAESGPMTVDIATDGPHALIAGTTGAGKSELLQTLIMSLACGNRPDQVVFVLVDYKGGAAFKDCARLPHTVGLVTDLDGHLTSRALTSLEAELRRREKLLADNGAKDIGDYDGSTPLPRLVLVIDEFRVLAEELPDFISGLVRIATVGRSLGIHLVLATQRPAGVVSPEIRANVNLRIALRVRDDSDSQDVIGTSAAARISSAQPGRALLRAGGSTPVAFQTARVGGVASGDAQILAAPADVRTGAPLWAPEVPAGQDTDLVRVSKAIIAATNRWNIPPQQSPWLPPLPGTVDLGGLPDAARSLTGQDVTPGPCSWPVALMDLPNEQLVAAAAWSPDIDGQVALVGGPRSGRTTAVRTIACQACRALAADLLHVYVLDGGGGLSALADLPHCGAVIGRDDTGRCSRLVDWLTDEVRRRQTLLASVGAGSYAEYVGLRDVSSLPRLLLIIDGWEMFAELSDDVTTGRLMDDLGHVIRDGAGVGIAVIATGGRALSSGRVSALFTARIAMRMPDDTDLLMLGLRPAQVPDPMPPGRGVIVPDATELQFALVGGTTSTAGQSDEIRRLAAEMASPSAVPPRFAALPQRVKPSQLSPCSAGMVPLGLGGDAAETVGWPWPAAGGLSALIAGPPRSGRTTALVASAQGFDGTRTTAYVGTDRPDGLPSGATLLDPADRDALGRWCAAHQDGALLVDDLDRICGTPTEEMLLGHAVAIRGTGGVMIAAGAAAALSGVFRGVVPELRRAQTGLLLQPGRHDGDLLGVRVGPLDRPRPGHGLLVIRGRALEIQVAHAGSG